jgi:hypothetical protein
LRDKGVFEALKHALLMIDRERNGRAVSPSACIIDSQSMKTSKAGGPRGYDAGRKIMGRKRHALVDTDGRGLVLFTHPPACRIVIELGRCSPPRIARSRSSRRSSPMPAIRDPVSLLLPALPLRSSAASLTKSASPSSHDDGWSSASSPGSTETAVSGKMRRPQSPPRLPFSMPLLPWS